MNERVFSVLLAFFFILAPAHGADPGSRLPESYTLGICSLRGEGIDREGRFFLHNIPNLFLDSLRGIPEHRLSDDEILAVGNYVVEETLKDLEDEIGRLVQERDELFFQENGQRRERIAASIENKEAERRDLLTGVITPGEIPNTLPLAPTGENLKGELLPPPGPFIDAYCKGRGIDLLLYGTLERVDDFFFLSVEVYNRYTGTVVFKESTAAGSRELASRAEELIIKLTGVILGRPWASLRVETVPPSASIYLNGAFSGAGVIYRPYASPGTYTIEGRAPGYKTERVELELSPEDAGVLALELTEAERRTFMVETDPPGADVYLASVWVGKSPVEVLYPGVPCRLEAVKDGYHRIFRILSAPPAENVILNLQPVSRAAYNMREDFRDKFYRDFGVFVLSIPVTLAGYSLAEHYSIALNEASAGGPVSSDEAYRLWLKAALCYNFYTAGLFANTFLFTNLVVSASEYVRRAGPAGQR